MVLRNQSDHKYADYLLCGILADKDVTDFVEAFTVISPSLYPDGNIPDLYQEALLLVVHQMPELLQNYDIDEEIQTRYNDFVSLISSGKGNQALRKYAGTYWAYVY